MLTVAVPPRLRGALWLISSASNLTAILCVVGPGVFALDAVQLRGRCLLRWLSLEYRLDVDTREALPFERSSVDVGSFIISDRELDSAAVHKRVIEIRSGYSSRVTLDSNQLFLRAAIGTTFIEPYPDLLLSLITPEDTNRTQVIPRRLQEVALSEFGGLESNNILFVDSTCVAKIGSNVNRIFFEILPSLAPRVHRHIHDVFFPFEYPKEWVRRGCARNVIYRLRAFLQIQQHVSRRSHEHAPGAFPRGIPSRAQPLCLKNRGVTICIRKDK